MLGVRSLVGGAPLLEHLEYRICPNKCVEALVHGSAIELGQVRTPEMLVKVGYGQAQPG